MNYKCNNTLYNFTYLEHHSKRSVSNHSVRIVSCSLSLFRTKIQLSFASLRKSMHFKLILKGQSKVYLDLWARQVSNSKSEFQARIARLLLGSCGLLLHLLFLIHAGSTVKQKIRFRYKICTVSLKRESGFVIIATTYPRWLHHVESCVFNLFLI